MRPTRCQLRYRRNCMFLHHCIFMLPCPPPHTPFFPSLSFALSLSLSLSVCVCLSLTLSLSLSLSITLLYFDSHDVFLFRFCTARERGTESENGCTYSLRGSNPRPMAHKTNTLTTELRELPCMPGLFPPSFLKACLHRRLQQSDKTTN